MTGAGSLAWGPPCRAGALLAGLTGECGQPSARGRRHRDGYRRAAPGAWEPPHRRSPGRQHRPRRGHPERRVRPRRDRYRRARRRGPGNHPTAGLPAGSTAGGGGTRSAGTAPWTGRAHRLARRAARNGPPASPQAHGAARQGHTEPVGRHHVTNLAVGQRLVRPAHLIPAPHTAVRLRSAPDGAGCSRPCAAHGPGVGAPPRPRTSEWREPAADGRGDTARPPASGTAGRGGASCPAQGVRDPAGVAWRVSASRQLTEPRLGAPVQPAATPPLTRPPAASPTVSARAQPTPRACVPGCGGGRGPVRWRRAPCGVRCRGPS